MLEAALAPRRLVLVGREIPLALSVVVQSRQSSAAGAPPAKVARDNSSFSAALLLPYEVRDGLGGCVSGV